MALYAISDLHLSLSVKDKSMDVFGAKWHNYTERLKDNWLATVKPEDTVLIAGDISWATYLEQCYNDFEFINKLPGNKIICKGNHDYWWVTLSKLTEYTNANSFNTIKFINNNYFAYNDIAICGTRGWSCPGSDGFNKEDLKIYLRELVRLELSLEQANKAGMDKKIVMLHYPPAINPNTADKGFIELFERYNVIKCIYGHLHNMAAGCAFLGDYGGIGFELVACDYLGFTPSLIK